MYMESANLHQHHEDHHLQLVGSSSSSSSLDNSSTDPSCYGASTASHDQWRPAGDVSLVGLSKNDSNEMINTKDHNNGSECMSFSHIHHPFLQQDLALQWHHNQSSYDDDDDDHHHHHEDNHTLSKIKKELSSSSDQIQADNIPTFTDMVNAPLATTKYSRINEHNEDFNDMPEKLLLKTVSSGFPISGEYYNYPYNSPSSSSSRRGSFSQIYPSVNISSLSQSPRMNMMNMNIPRPFDMNMHVLDGRLFSGSGLVNNGKQSEISLEIMGRGSLPFGLGDHHLQQTIQPTCTPIDQMHHFSNDRQASEGQREDLLMATTGRENAPKKPRVEPRSSCPPLKVRKEKLGDRISALQQLVSPFGKTDTASVLMEAIGYIKFLQNQIETLSVPYMRASRNREEKSSQGGSVSHERNEEPKMNLRSLGLCLVPLSCMSYVTGEG